LNSVRCGKRGFTVAELCVVLALVGIISVMIISFSVMMGDHTDALDAQYDFLEECTTLENALRIWVAEYDVPTNTFAVADGKLAINGTTGVEFRNGKLSLGEKSLPGLNTVAAVSFEEHGDLIKCNITAAQAGMEQTSVSFVFSLRAGAIARAGGA
jgi:prepilin-type N-terminal cleavage/methylation domain-containing protein